MTSAYLKSSIFLKSSIEEQLLLCCTRTKVDEVIADQINQLIQQLIDWEELIELAIYHQVIPLLYRNLKQVNSELIPAEVLSQLQNLNFANVALSLSLTSKLLNILIWFATENIEVIPYKGSVLGALVYRDICLRQYLDIDLLVSPDNITTAGDLLIAQGYQLRDQYQWEQTFIYPDQRVPVDLHQGLAQSHFPCRLVFADCIQRCQSVDLLNGTVKSFSWEDLLLVLSVQVIKDSSDETCALAKICDIAELVQQHLNLQWELVIERATSIGCQRLLLIALLLAHELLGTNLPISIWQLIKKDWVVCQYGKLLSRKFFRPRTASPVFRILKILILIEYPLSAPHNIQLLKGVLTYPYTKLSNFMSNIKQKSNDPLAAESLPSLAASEAPESKNKSTTPQSRR
jgi:Uncharacterised nucleotidyltransferase